MASLANPSFPSCSDSRVVLSRLHRMPACGTNTTDGSANTSVRGVEGLRPGVISFPWIEIDWRLDAIYQPVACIATDEPLLGRPGACSVSVDALDRVTWWLKKITWAGPGERPDPPPQLTFEVRPAVGGTSDLALAGLTNFISWEDNAELAQASGILCSQWELWARIHPTEPSTSKVRILVAGAADRVGGGVFNVHFGLLATAFP